MSRTVKQHDVRRNEILDVARRHFDAKGYEHTSVQAIINEVGIAKGTFYHYFPSKLDLIDALVDRMLEESLGTTEPAVADQGLSSLEKMLILFDDTMRWKAENDTFFSSVLTREQSDHNVLLRQKLGDAWGQRLLPLMTSLVQQGLYSGLFDTADPAEIGDIIWRLLLALRDVGTKLLTGDESLTPAEQETLWVRWDTYQFCIERVLGLPAGVIDFTQAQTMAGMDPAVLARRPAGLSTKTAPSG